MTRFVDRVAAGRALATRLGSLRLDDPIVLGLPRGGVPVAAEVAHALGAALDVIVVRKLRVPCQPEFAFGAIGEGGVRVIDADVVRTARVEDDEISAVQSRERAELESRVCRFHLDRAPPTLAGRTVVIVDDGVATGATARAACQVARARGASRIVFATPVGARDALDSLSIGSADEVVCLDTPQPFHAVGQWYEHFDQVTDTEVIGILSGTDQ